MDLVLAQILGLGKAPSSFGVTLAMILTWGFCVLGLTVAAIWFTIGQVKAEHQENVERAAAFDAKYSDR